VIREYDYAENRKYGSVVTKKKHLYVSILDCKIRCIAPGGPFDVNAIANLWNNFQRKKYRRNIDAYRQNYQAAPGTIRRLLPSVPNETELDVLSLQELIALDKNIVDLKDFDLLKKEIEMKAAEEKDGTRCGFKATTGPKNIFYLELYCYRSNENKGTRIINMYADLFAMYGDLKPDDATDIKFMSSRQTFKYETQYVTLGYTGSIDMMDEDNRHFRLHLGIPGGGRAEALALMHDSVRQSQKTKKRDAITSRLIGECMAIGIFPDPRA
jgi:hypothetical protein